MSSIEIADDHGNVQVVPVPQKGAGWDGDDRQQVGQLARSEAGRTAGAVAAGHLVAGFLDDGSTATSQKAAEVINDLGQSLANSDFAPEQSQPGPVTQTPSGLVVVQQPQEVIPMPTDYVLPDAYAFLNEDDAPEVEDDLELPPAAAAETVELDEEDLADPRMKALHDEAVAARKQADHERNLRVKASRPQWEAEALRVFRLGEIDLLDADDLSSIKATSHREFLREAKVIADRNKKAALRFAPATPAPAPQPGPEIISREKQEMWGAPPAGQPPADLADNNREARIARARGTGKLANVFKEMIRSE